MLDKSLDNPTTQLQQLQQTLKRLADYGRRPQGIAVLGSIGLHGLAALTIPFWASSNSSETEPEQPGMVQVIDLPPEVQNRLPSTSAALDLSVFETSPDFNLDLSGLNGQALDPNGTYIPGLNVLPTPMAPNFGQNNFSFIPLSPPPIASSYTGFTPPPPPRNMSFLPPPPNIPIQGDAPFPSAPGRLSDSSELPRVRGNSGDNNADGQAEFSITPNPARPNPDLIQRQRQLEAETAIALQPRNNDSGGDVRFDADLLKPQALRNGNNSSSSNNNRPAPAAQAPTQTARNSAAVNRNLTGNYPRGACSSEASGTAVYSVAVSPEGAPSQWNLVQSSGSNALDNQASQEIRNARFDGANSNYRVSVNFQYNANFCAAFVPKPQTAPSNPSNLPPAPANTTPKPTETTPEAIAPDTDS
ncbi:TonB family protein [Synechococcus moorigangaii CMS01]|nr:TonB family protein [Synechococcus moorigangaii CMS01]